MCGCKSIKIGKMARNKKANVSNMLMNAAFGAVGAITSRVVSGYVGGGTIGSIAKIGGGAVLAMSTKNTYAQSFGGGMILDGAVDFIGPSIAPIINQLSPGSSTLALRGLRHSAPRATAAPAFKTAM